MRGDDAEINTFPGVAIVRMAMAGPACLVASSDAALRFASWRCS